MCLKRPEILCDILLSPCFVLIEGVREGSWGPVGVREVAGGGENVCSCTPLVSHTYSTHINTHKPLSPSFFGNSPESWLN